MLLVVNTDSNRTELLVVDIPEDALNDDSGEDADKSNPDERISSMYITF